MILSDREIKAALARGSFKITPDPRADATLWSSTAIDLRLDKNLSFWKPSDPGVEVFFRPGHPDYNFENLVRNYLLRTEIGAAGQILKPGQFCLGWTIEKIQLPHRSRIAARVEGKSGLARLGIGVHVTAPTIHAGFGFKGDDWPYPGSPIQLEIWNVGANFVKMDEGMKICQLIFETVDGTPEKGYEGQFNLQGPGQK